MLPADAKQPTFPLIATIDCAALPADVTDLPLPADGQLLLFGWPEEHGYGQVMYVPAGVAVEEKRSIPGLLSGRRGVCRGLRGDPAGDLHSRSTSLPYVKTIPGPRGLRRCRGSPFEEMTEVWQDVLGDVPDGMFSFEAGRRRCCWAATALTATASTPRGWAPIPRVGRATTGRCAVVGHPTMVTGSCWPSFTAADKAARPSTG
ncbi:hypothetical protein NKG94_22650 [Micromonospora sp. M12]